MVRMNSYTNQILVRFHLYMFFSSPIHSYGTLKFNDSVNIEKGKKTVRFYPKQSGNGNMYPIRFSGMENYDALCKTTL